MKISDILNVAADEVLWDGGRRGDYAQFSCGAICHAVFKNDKTPFSSYNAICEYLNELGLNSESSSEFDEFTVGEDRQGARYLWLKFAALVAKDEGQ